MLRTIYRVYNGENRLLYYVSGTEEEEEEEERGGNLYFPHIATNNNQKIWKKKGKISALYHVL